MSFPITQAARLVGVNSTGSIGEKPDDTPNPKGLAVVILTDSDPDHQEFAQELVNKCVAELKLTAEHLSVGGADLPEKVKELRRQGKIGDGTQIIIDTHGGMDAERKTHWIGGSVATIDVVNAVREADESGKKCSANVYITGCMAGDHGLRTQIEKLHADQPAGACYLMSSKKAVLKKDYQPALRDMCMEIAVAKREQNGPALDHRIFTRMAQYQQDCITMVNRDGVTIRHAPKIDKHFALAGLIADIESRLPIEAEPSSQTGNEADGKPDASSLVTADEKRPGTGGKTTSTKKEQKKEKR